MNVKKKEENWMRKKTKKWAVVLTVSMLAGLISGCTSNENTSSSTGESASSASSESASVESTTSSESTAAETDSGEREVITLAIAQNANVENYDTNHQTLLLEEALGIDIEFVYLPSAKEDAKSKLALMISSGSELPDVIINPEDALTHLEVAEYGSQGIFLPLNEYMDDAEYFNMIADEDKEQLISASTAPDGNIYTLCNFVIEPSNQVPYKMWINQTWLDTLGLEVPTTTEEYYQVLKAFAEQDPNGNGKADEIALTGCTDGWGCNAVVYLMNSFVFYGDDVVNGGLSLSDDGTEVIAPFATDGWRAGLEYMNKLCSEGLLSPSIFTQDNKQFTAILSAEEQITGSCTAGGYGYWTGAAENENLQDMVIIGPLEGPEGLAYASYTDFQPKPRLMITKDCDNPELAFKLGDLFYRHDVSLTSRYGEEGVDWTEDPEITKDYTGLFEESEGIPCTMAQLDIQWSKVQNKHWYNVAPTYRSLEMFQGIDGEYPDDPDARNFRVELNRDTLEYYYYAHPDEVLPALVYTMEEAEDIAEIEENIKTYVDESMAAFITGNRPLSDWDNYLNELEQMGLSTWIEKSQGAFDRMG